MKETLSVSIIAANYNNGKYLKDFIGSINRSSVLPKELIIVDDGSLDGSIDILNGYADLKYLKILKFDKNRGFCKALNLGIKNATGDYIMRVDPDDIVLKDRIKPRSIILKKTKTLMLLAAMSSIFTMKRKRRFSGRISRLIILRFRKHM